MSIVIREGGPGSGNWAHKGRPGKRGGSMPGSGGGGGGGGVLGTISPAAVKLRSELIQKGLDGIKRDFPTDWEGKDTDWMVNQMDAVLKKAGYSQSERELATSFYRTRLYNRAAYLRRKEGLPPVAPKPQVPKPEVPKPEAPKPKPKAPAVNAEEDLKADFQKQMGWQKMPPTLGGMAMMSLAQRSAQYNAAMDTYGPVGLVKAWTAERYGFDKQVVAALEQPAKALNLGELNNMKAAEVTALRLSDSPMDRLRAQVFGRLGGNKADRKLMIGAIDETLLKPGHILMAKEIGSNDSYLNANSNAAGCYHFPQARIALRLKTVGGIAAQSSPSAVNSILVHELGHAMDYGPGHIANVSVYNVRIGEPSHPLHSLRSAFAPAEAQLSGASFSGRQKVLRQVGMTDYGMTNQKEWVAEAFTNMVHWRVPGVRMWSRQAASKHEAMAANLGMSPEALAERFDY